MRYFGIPRHTQSMVAYKIDARTNSIILIAILFYVYCLWSITRDSESHIQQGMLMSIPQCITLEIPHTLSQ